LGSGQGIVSRSELDNSERDAVLDFDKNVNYQKDLLIEIGKDINNASSNLKTIVTEVKSQGDTINRIVVNTKDAEISVKRTDKNINLMQRRMYCQKFLLHLLAFLLFIANIIVLIYKIIK
jgi:methyl-accepting chemotaxis protein